MLINMKASFFIGIFWVGTLAAAYYVGRSSGSDDEQVFSNAPESLSSHEAPTTGSLRLLGNSKNQTENKETAQKGEAAAGSNASGAGRRSAGSDLFQTAFKDSDPIKQLNALTTLLENLGPDNIDEAIAAFEAEGTRGNERELSLFAYAWAKFDGPSALAYLDENGGRHADWAKSTAISAWATVDPDAAIAYARENEVEGDGNQLMAGVVSGLAESDVQLAGTLVHKELPYGRARGHAARRVVEAMVDQGGVQSAEAWLETIPNDDSFKPGASALLAGIMAGEDPEAAAEWVLGLDSGVQRRSVGTVAKEWSEKSPEVAARWVDTLPQNVKSTGMENVVEEWARKDSKATAEWLNQYPASPDMDEPVQKFAYAISRSDPESAISWASSITNESVRNRTVSEVARSWVRRDMGGAKAYFEKSGEPVPDAVKRLLRTDS